MRTEYNGLIITGTPEEMMAFAQLLTEEPKPEPKPAPKAPDPKKQGAKKQLDMGKVKALRNAGWSFDKIADEIGVSAQTIANRLKAASKGGQE
jgi:hypothetical protein